MTLVVQPPQGLRDEISDLKDTPKDYLIVIRGLESARAGARGKLRGALSVAVITSKYIWKYHKKKSIVTVGGIVVAGLSSSLFRPRSTTRQPYQTRFRQPRRYSGSRQFRSRSNRHCRCTRPC